jgi:hypothetical protein
MDTNDLQEARTILAELQRVHAEFEELMRVGEQLKNSRAYVVEEFRDRLIALKAYLKERSKNATIDGRKRAMTRLESAFFDPAVRSALAHFGLRVNAPAAQWVSGLYESASDISYYAFQLEDHINESSG